MENQEWHQWSSTARKPRPSYGAAPSPFERPRVPEETLKELFVQVERKLFIVALKQNDRGRFLRLTEEKGGRHTTVIVPDTGLKELHQALGEIIAASESLPSKSAPSAT